MSVAQEIADALAQLMRARILDLGTLAEIAVGLSRRGHSRREIVDFFYRMAIKFQNDLAEEDLDMIGDLSHHIAGDQCPINQIVRLHNDPQDPIALADLVAREMKGWTPPDGW